ncbi:MAG TPA: hypothetical protein VF156_15380 [Agromyces sp.]
MKRIRVKEKDGQHEYPASPDGTHTYGYKAGSVYDLPDDLADLFLREGWGVESDASDDSTTELPEGYDLPETEAERRERVANAAGISPPGLDAIAASSPGAVEEVVARNPHLARTGSGQQAVATAIALEQGTAEIRDVDGDGTRQLVGDVPSVTDVELPDTNETPTAGALGAQPAAVVDGEGGASTPHYPPSETEGGVSDPGGADADGDGVGDDGSAPADEDGKPELPDAKASRADHDAVAVQLGIDPAEHSNKQSVRDAIARELGLD